MKRHSTAAWFAFASASSALALFALCTPALAEEEGNLSAADILLPNANEFIPALIAFAVIWAVLAKFVWPSVVRQLDERQQTIQKNLDDAEAARKNTEKAFKTAQAEIDKAQLKADNIIADAKHQADANRAAILEQANKDAKRIADKARENIEIERENARTDLTNQAANLAVDLASKIVDKELDQSQQKHLIERALKAQEQAG